MNYSWKKHSTPDEIISIRSRHSNKGAHHETKYLHNLMTAGHMCFAETDGEPEPELGQDSLSPSMDTTFEQAYTTAATSNLDWASRDSSSAYL